MLNRCDFIGRIVRDPEARITKSGKNVVNFSLAVSEKRGGEEKTEWVNVICWERTANFVVNYMGKGSLCYVSGKMQTRKWQDKNGNDRFTTEIIANTVQNLSFTKDDSGRNEDQPQHSSGYGENDQIPF